eukprot:TRINITY_DN16424_c0_g1_i5.p3 TRINITY_DN16424_c0_g1~~TRINITY_DN16424_c0_g1_i5.p3  ORF type:complete len:281 (-),score=24.28 TRINITY_DN16424_c0_g1_i5:123-899(-)
MKSLKLNTPLLTVVLFSVLLLLAFWFFKQQSNSVQNWNWAEKELKQGTTNLISQGQVNGSFKEVQENEHISVLSDNCSQEQIEGDNCNITCDSLTCTSNNQNVSQEEEICNPFENRGCDKYFQEEYPSPLKPGHTCKDYTRRECKHNETQIIQLIKDTQLEQKVLGKFYANKYNSFYFVNGSEAGQQFLLCAMPKNGVTRTRELIMRMMGIRGNIWSKKALPFPYLNTQVVEANVGFTPTGYYVELYLFPMLEQVEQI